MNLGRKGIREERKGRRKRKTYGETDQRENAMRERRMAEKERKKGRKFRRDEEKERRRG